MAVPADFAELVRRVRAGDAAAAEELVRRYEPEVRRAVRMRLIDPRLRRVLDSTDICQSVLGQFFVRVAAGQFDLEQPEDLLKLLVVMARNKLRNQADRHRAGIRDLYCVEGGEDMLQTLPSPAPGPDQVAVGRDLLERVRRHLSSDERAVADRRAAGCDWPQIARELGGTPEARRKQLARALDRVTAELNLDGSSQG